MTQNGKVVVLTGTCGSGKSTVAGLLALKGNWHHVSEDDLWLLMFGKDRGLFGTAQHRLKRAAVHQEVMERVRAALDAGVNAVVDATVHESPPEALEEYRAWFQKAGIRWHLCVLHPRLEVAIERDATRTSGSLGAARVESLYAKFTRRVIAQSCFLDTSADSPAATVERVLDAIANQPWQ